MNHAWLIHTARAGSNNTFCDPVDGIYNPYSVNTSKESGYLNDCTALSQLRCAMGDLSGKLGELGLEPVTTTPRKTYSFYDVNLHLLGPFSSELGSAWKNYITQALNTYCGGVCMTSWLLQLYVPYVHEKKLLQTI